MFFCPALTGNRCSQRTGAGDHGSFESVAAQDRIIGRSLTPSDKRTGTIALSGVTPPPFLLPIFRYPFPRRDELESSQEGTPERLAHFLVAATR